MSLPLIELKNAKKKYLNQIFNMTINQGDFILITGGNGSGKTTLISLILSFIKPDSGQVISRLKKINYVPEKAHLPINLSVLSYLMLISKLKGVKVDEALLRELNIPLLKKVEKLSKGNYQKVALYQTFIGQADLYIFDEPFSGLDHDMVKTVVDLFKAYQSQGHTLMISTHQKQAFKGIVCQEIAL